MSYTLPQKRQLAKQMRKDPTRAEADLWLHIRNRKTGFRFERQIVLHGYIVDFYCRSLKLAIEVDGSVHEVAEMKMRDDKKDSILSALGVTVLRFTNQDVCDFPSVVLHRLKAVASDLARTPLSVLRSSSKPCGSVEKQLPIATVCTSAVDDSQRKPATAADIAEMYAALRKLVSKSRTAFAPEMNTADKVNDQRLRLQEWMKKRNGTAAALCATEPQALALKGIEVKGA